MKKGNGRKLRRGTRGSCWKGSPVELGEHLLGRETGSARRGRAALQVLDASMEAGEAAAEVDRGGCWSGSLQRRGGEGGGLLVGGMGKMRRRQDRLGGSGKIPRKGGDQVGWRRWAEWTDGTS